MKPNGDRNKELVLKRMEDPRKWSFGELGKFYRLDKTTTEDIFKRDMEKYATPAQVEEYLDFVEKKGYYYSRGELSTD